MADRHLKVGDLTPPIVATLEDDDGPIDLTGVTVTGKLRRADGGYSASRAATITDAPNGRVSWAWIAADTETAGDYFFAFVVTAGGLPAHYPNRGELTIRVETPRAG